MKFELDKQTASFLLGMINRPQILPFSDVSPNFRPYTATDEPGGRQLAALRRWAQDRILPALEKHKGSEDDDIIFQGGLKKVYIDRVLDILTHYKPIGLLVQCVTPYMSLKDALEGKTFEIDDPSEDEDKSE